MSAADDITAADQLLNQEARDREQARKQQEKVRHEKGLADLRREQAARKGKK